MLKLVQMNFPKLKPYLFVIFLQLGTASLNVFAKAALNHGLNHYTLATYRNLIAAVVIAPFAIFFEREGRPTLTFLVVLKIMLLGFLEPVVDQNLFYAGMKYTTATFAVAMGNIIPAMTFIMAWACGLEKVNIKKIHSIGKIVGTLVTVGGAMIMTLVVGPAIVLPWTKVSATAHQDEGATHVSRADNIKGSMMIIAGYLSWSCFYVLQAITLKSYPAELSLAALICAAGSFQNGILMLIAKRGDTEAWKLHLDAGLGIVIYGGVICSGLGYYLGGILMKEKGPVFVTAFNPLSMVIAAILGSAFFSEKLNLGRVIGAIVVVSGLYVVIWGKRNDENQSNTEGESDVLPAANQQTQTNEMGNIDSLSIEITPTNRIVTEVNGEIE